MFLARGLRDRIQWLKGRLKIRMMDNAHKFYHCNILRVKRLLNLHSMQLSALSYYIAPLRSKYFLQQPVPKCLQSVLFPQYQRPGFTPIQNYKPHLYILIFTFFRHQTPSQTVLNWMVSSGIEFHLILIRNNHKTVKRSVSPTAETDVCCSPN